MSCHKLLWAGHVLGILGTVLDLKYTSLSHFTANGYNEVECDCYSVSAWVALAQLVEHLTFGLKGPGFDPGHCSLTI